MASDRTEQLAQVGLKIAELWPGMLVGAVAGGQAIADSACRLFDRLYEIEPEQKIIRPVVGVRKRTAKPILAPQSVQSKASIVRDEVKKRGSAEFTASEIRKACGLSYMNVVSALAYQVKRGDYVKVGTMRFRSVVND